MNTYPKSEFLKEASDLALEMNTEEANFYSAMAYPGSPLHGQAKEIGWKLPEQYVGYSQHSYYCQPLPTKHLKAEQVLAFRDEAWMKYHTNPAFLDLLKKRDLGVTEISKHFSISLPSLSHHLSVLKGVNLVTSQRKGQEIIYSLNFSVFEEVANKLVKFFKK